MNYWEYNFDNDLKTFCGPGSTLEYTKPLLNFLPNLIIKYNIQSMFDAGCGDLNWIKQINLPCSYLGGEISRNILDFLENMKIKNFKVIKHDAVNEVFPKVDLLLVRDLTIHLNNSSKMKLLKNFIYSSIDFMLISNNLNVIINEDFQYGEKFPEAKVNWLKHPWHFPQPLDILPDNTFRKNLSLFNKKQISDAILLIDNNFV